jgi:Tat protein translocase TatB subunit
MGGLGPGIGGSEWFIIGLVALLVVGPERLPGLLRQLGKVVAKARGMANEFRASFDEMARQSELDELRKEVEALRTGQNSPVRLGAEADAAFKGIKDEFDKPLFADTPVVPETVAEPVAARRFGMAGRRAGDDADRHAAADRDRTCVGEDARQAQGAGQGRGRRPPRPHPGPPPRLRPLSRNFLQNNAQAPAAGRAEGPRAA